MRNPCKECDYYHKENNTCQSKKCCTGGYGYITWIDRLFCKPYKYTADHKDEPTISKMEQVDKPQYDAEDQFCIEHNCPHFYQFGGCMNQGDCPYDEDEPQTYITEDRTTQVLDGWQTNPRTSTTAIEDEPKTEPQTCDDCIWSVCNYNKAFEDEPQTCSVSGRPYSECADCEHFRCTADEPQTERSIE